MRVIKRSIGIGKFKCPENGNGLSSRVVIISAPSRHMYEAG